MNRHTQGVGLWNQVDCYSQLERVVPCYDHVPRYMKRRLFPFFALHRRWVLIIKSALIVWSLIATSQFALADQAFDDLLARAMAGNADAQYNLGLMYAKGLGVEQDEGKAVDWYSKIAAGEYAEAAKQGGMPANPPCDDVLTRAAQQSEPEAMLELLGGCLAVPAKPGVHIHVAVEMARISLQSGDREDTARYLDLLHSMLESNQGPDRNP